MGEMKGISLAEKLKMKSDSQHVNIVDQIHNQLYGEIMQEADRAASAGLYEATIYGANLENNEVVSSLKKSLKGHGFKVYTGRTRGLGKVVLSQSFLTISWK